jgi:hypothetical protein
MLFPSNTGRIFKKHLRKYSADSLPYRGANRRATSLLPQPMITSDIMAKGATINMRGNMLLSLEANQKSGCLIVRSEKNKSRAGILMYRGRILGCMRGQKKSHEYAFGNLAYERTLEDLANMSQTDIYDLKDELVAAAGALFHGEMHEQSVKPIKQSFDEELNKLIDSKLPGCVVITDKDTMDTCIVYIFSGQIVGVHSRKQGWLKPKVDVVHKYLKACRNPRVQSCAMPCQDIAEFKRYSFSLSGLADRDFSKTPENSEYDEPNFFGLQRHDKLRQKPGLINSKRRSTDGDFSTYSVHP